MLRGYAARKAKREEEARLASERWTSLLQVFGSELGKAGVSIDGLIHHHRLTSPETEASWQVWWNRSEEEQQLKLVKEGLRKRYLTPTVLYGAHSAGPAEWQSIELLAEAGAVSRDALLSALLLTTLRSLDECYQFDPSSEARETLSFVCEQVYRALERENITTYTTAKTWFLPERLRLTGSPQTSEEMIEHLASLISEFLVAWVPVQLEVSLVSPRPGL